MIYTNPKLILYTLPEQCVWEKLNCSILDNSIFFSYSCIFYFIIILLNHLSTFSKVRNINALLMKIFSFSILLYVHKQFIISLLFSGVLERRHLILNYRYIFDLERRRTIVCYTCYACIYSRKSYCKINGTYT